jgi:hypothetical protein
MTTDDDRINACRDELLRVCQEHFADRPDALTLTVCALGRARTTAVGLIDTAATLREWTGEFEVRR